jgi:hypothetical protein
MSGLFEILATVVIEFTASPHSAFVGDFVRLWSLHHMRPFALAAMEGINNRNVSLAVRNDCSHPSHSNSFSQSDASRVPAASACVMGLFPSGETTCDKVAICCNPLWRTLLRLWARMSGRLPEAESRWYGALGEATAAVSCADREEECGVLVLRETDSAHVPPAPRARPPVAPRNPPRGETSPRSCRSTRSVGGGDSSLAHSVALK